MEPTSAVLTAMGARIATDTVTFDGLQIVLVMNEFTPGPTLVIGDLDIADFDGSGAIEAPATGLNAATDPATGDILLTAMPPAGGWYWETTGVTNLPQTIYGYAALNNAEAVLRASERLETSVTLTAAGQAIELESVRMRILNGAIR